MKESCNSTRQRQAFGLRFDEDIWTGGAPGLRRAEEGEVLGPSFLPSPRGDSFRSPAVWARPPAPRPSFRAPSRRWMLRTPPYP